MLNILHEYTLEQRPHQPDRNQPKSTLKAKCFANSFDAALRAVQPFMDRNFKFFHQFSDTAVYKPIDPQRFNYDFVLTRQQRKIEQILPATTPK
jgi:hypothetical protein